MLERFENISRFAPITTTNGAVGYVEGDIWLHVTLGTTKNPLSGDIYVVVNKTWVKETNQYVSGSKETFLFKTINNYTGSKQVLSTPFLFYFGLRPDKTSLDTLIKYYGPKGAFPSTDFCLDVITPIPTLTPTPTPTLTPTLTPTPTPAATPTFNYYEYDVVRSNTGGGGIGGGYGMPVMGNRTTAPTTPTLETAKPVNVQTSTSSSKTAEEGVSKSTLADAQNMINWGIAPMRTFIINRYPTAPIEAVNKAGSQIATFQKSNSGMSGAEANPKIIAMIDSLIKPVITAMSVSRGSGSSIGRPNVGGA
jgi:hypothetical protein